jgi:DNA-binding HxlR family transcriptional regulator
MVLKVRPKIAAPKGCPLSACMVLLRGAWTLEVMWSLSGGPPRFSEMRRDHSAISAKVLSARLKDIETRCVVTRSTMQTRPPTVEYGLTDLGQQLIPVVHAIVEVASSQHLRQIEAFGPPPESAHSLEGES